MGNWEHGLKSVLLILLNKMRRQRISVVVLGEGITEKYYFESLRDLLPIKPVAKILKHTTVPYIDKMINQLINDGYDRIYCLIDMDNKIKDGTALRKKNREEYDKLKRKYHNKTITRKEGESKIVMIESYPSTELFFLYYFGYKGAEFNNTQLKNILNRMTGYKVEEHFFIKNALHSLFVKKGGSLEVAIEASQQSMMRRDILNPYSSYTEIGKLIEELGYRIERN